jgi:hypothetical protein
MFDQLAASQAIMQDWMKSLFLFVLFVFSVGRLPAMAATSDLPSSDTVVKAVIERAKLIRSLEPERKYAYLKETRTEEFDASGKVVKERAKTQQVFPDPDGGAPVKVRVYNRQLSDDELRRIAAERDEDEEEAAKAKEKRAVKIEFDETLVSRYQFVVERREWIARRSTLVMTFSPKRNQPVRQMQDRLLNEAVGTLWIDEQEFELVKADIRLREPVSIASGLVGAVQTFRYILERTRVEPGVWLLKKTDMFIRGRQLFSPVHRRKQEFCSSFKKPDGTRFE